MDLAHARSIYFLKCTPAYTGVHLCFQTDPRVRGGGVHLCFQMKGGGSGGGDDEGSDDDILYNEIFDADENEQEKMDPVALWVPMEIDEDGSDAIGGAAGAANQENVTLTRQDFQDNQSEYSLRLCCTFLCTASYTLSGETPLNTKKTKKFHA